jgi:hypothetical protein
MAGGSVGLDDVVTGAVYGIGGVSAYAASGQMAVANITTLMREVWDDAVEQVGEKVARSATAPHIERMKAFYRGSSTPLLA